MKNNDKTEKVLKLLAKLQKAGCLEIYKKLNTKIFRYILMEWDVKPTEKEMIELLSQFYGNPDDKDLDKLFNAVTPKEFEMLAALTFSVIL